MNEDAPFDNLLDQVADLLALVQEKKSTLSKDKSKKDVPYEDIDEQLDALERDVELFRLITDEALKQSNISEETLKGSIEKPDEALSGKQKRILLRAKELKKEADKFGQEIEKESRIAKAQKKKKKMTGKKRKKKFKRLGGTDWLPL